MNAHIPGKDATLEIIAFHLGDQQLCIKTTSIREIRGWAAATPLPIPAVCSRCHEPAWFGDPW